MDAEALAQLFPSLSKTQLDEAKENLDQYILLAWEIWEDDQSTLTAERLKPTIKIKVDPGQTLNN
jgi:alcohol dehydrogenase YqhD (iron-dependent ADH family)